MRLSNSLVFVWHVTLLLVVSLIPVDATVAQDTSNSATDKVNYKGFTIDVAAIKSSSNASVVRGSLQQQIDIIENVRLRPEQRDFFKTVPIIVIAVESGPLGRVGGAQYSSTLTPDGRRDRRIVVGSNIQPSPNPILLHELLHAYHEQRLPGGIGNPEIEKLFLQAKAQQRFPADSYMLLLCLSAENYGPVCLRRSAEETGLYCPTRPARTSEYSLNPAIAGVNARP